MQFGAALMLGVALLSPLNALAQGQQQIGQTYQQTTEIVMAGQQQKDDGVDWFNTEVDGRTWNNAGAPQGMVYHVPSWVRDGVLRTPEEALAMEQQAGDVPMIEMADQAHRSEQIPDVATPSKLGSKLDAIWAAHDAQIAQRQAEYAAEKAASARSEIASRVDAPSFEISRNEYNFYKDYDMDGASIEQATPAQREKFIARLVHDAYVEMQAGHTVESPSQRLVDICHYVQDVAKAPVQAPAMEHGQEVFQSCQSEQMQSSMLINTFQKAAGYTGIAIAAIVAKGLGIGAFVLAGNVLGAGTGFGNLLAARRGPDDQEPKRRVSPPTVS